MAQTAMSEDQMVDMVRNALLVAGHEMGEKGDHWPVVNATIYDMMKDLEELRIERNVFEQVKMHYADMLKELAVIRDDSPEPLKAEIEATLSELRALYRACFEEVDKDNLYIDPENLPPYIKRAHAIIKTLEDEDE